MKIEEPKTPFEVRFVRERLRPSISDDDLQVYESDGEDQQELDANLLAAKIAAEGNKGPRPRRWVGTEHWKHSLFVLQDI